MCTTWNGAELREKQSLNMMEQFQTKRFFFFNQCLCFETIYLIGNRQLDEFHINFIHCIWYSCMQYQLNFWLNYLCSCYLKRHQSILAATYQLKRFKWMTPNYSYIELKSYVICFNRCKFQAKAAAQFFCSELSYGYYVGVIPFINLKQLL